MEGKKILTGSIKNTKKKKMTKEERRCEEVNQELYGIKKTIIINSRNGNSQHQSINCPKFEIENDYK